MNLQNKVTVALVNVWWCRCCRREEHNTRLAVLLRAGEEERRLQALTYFRQAK